MEETTVWYLTDNDHGKKISDAVKNLGIGVNLVQGNDLKHVNLKENQINIFIFDLIKIKPEKLIRSIEDQLKTHSSPKFVILTKKEIKQLLKISYNVLHLEFLSRPVYKHEFLLLLEKTIIVERYREVLKSTSVEADSRIETYESLLDINRKNVFESETEKEAFQKILVFEKGLLKEQYRLNESIKDFSRLRQVNLFDMQNRIKAEESLAELRQMELMDAKDVIDAQESLIDFSVSQIEEKKGIIDASENVAELSRSEAIKLHEDLKREKELNRSLSEEIEKLLSELEGLRDKMV